MTTAPIIIITSREITMKVTHKGKVNPILLIGDRNIKALISKSLSPSGSRINPAFDWSLALRAIKPSRPSEIAPRINIINANILRKSFSGT
jgi:hypothetical protein